MRGNSGEQTLRGTGSAKPIGACLPSTDRSQEGGTGALPEVENPTLIRRTDQ
jgi:hypothetical protein